MTRRAALTLSAIGFLAVVGALALAVAGSAPSASVRGGLIAFPMDGERGARGDAGIFVTRLGATPRRIIGAIDDDMHEACPAFSPDGRLLAYGVLTVGQSATGDDERSWVVIVSLDSDGNATRLHRLPGGEFSGHAPCPTWSPDSSAVAWHDLTELWIAPMDGAVANRDLTPNRGGSPLPISWTHDGRAIAVALHDQVLIVPVDGGEPRTLMTARTDGDLHEDFHSVAASPTGPMLAVAGEWWRAEPGVGRSQASGFIRVLDPAGRVVVEETGRLQARWPLTNGAPAWSPDGTRLAWGSDRGLEMLDVEKGTPVALDPGPWLAEGGSPISLASSVGWSPDGTRLLFIGHATDHDQWALVSIAADGPPDPILLTDWGFELYAEFGEDLTWQPPAP